MASIKTKHVNVLRLTPSAFCELDWLLGQKDMTLCHGMDQ